MCRDKEGRRSGPPSGLETTGTKNDPESVHLNLRDTPTGINESEFDWDTPGLDFRVVKESDGLHRVSGVLCYKITESYRRVHEQLTT